MTVLATSRTILHKSNFIMLVLASFVSCGSTANTTGRTRVVVNTTGGVANADEIVASWTVNEKTDPRSPFSFDHSTNSFLINFGEPISGPLVVGVEQTQGKCYVASGQGQIVLDGQDRYELTVVLATQPKSCPLTVVKKGNGSVSSTPAGLECGSSCTYRFPAGQQVALAANPTIPSSPYLWGGSCSGRAGCQVQMNGAVTVTVDFAPPLCNGDGWCWEYPQPQGNNLNSVWVAPDQTVFAVGDGGVVLRTNGISWASLPSPANGILNGVWGTTATNVWAVGSGPLGSSVTMHWDGSSWASVPNPSAVYLLSVWGSAANDVWAVGAGGTIIHYDGAKWSFSASSVTETLTSIWGTGPTDVWAAGSNGVVVHNNGAGWSLVPNTAGSTVNAIWGTGSADIWLGGSQIQRWNGSALVLGSTGTPASGFYGLWGSSVNSVWAASVDKSIRHWDGLQWSVAAQPFTSAYLKALAGTSNNSAWAVGQYGAIAKYEGASWKPISTQPDLSFFSAWMSGPYDGWAVGRKGAMFHWNGVEWLAAEKKTANDLSSIWGTGPQDLWAVGAGGLILRYNGISWTVVTDSRDPLKNLNDIHGTGPNDIWAVGDDGLVGGQALHWNGLMWEKGPKAPYGLSGVFVSNGVVYAAARDKGIFSLSGQTWIQESKLPAFKIVGHGTDLVAAGDGLHQRRGSVWSTVVADQFFYGLHASKQDDVWAVGDQLLHYDGTNWTQTNAGVAGRLWGVTGVGTHDVWVVGEGGAILHQRR